MKRLYMGIFVLALLLAIGLFISFAMNRIYTPITNLLEEAAAAALQENVSDAKEKAEKAKTLWDKYKNATATVADHTPMEDIDHLFAEMDIYMKADEHPHFAACCAQLAVKIQNMGDAHKLNLWNLL